MRVVVAMSGGVDSSAAAGLLVEQGHEVIGVAMKTHSLPARSNRACCTPDDMRDARRVADHLGIPFYVLNYEDLFEREVVEPFAEAYATGFTPNPCVDCNEKVKFKPLLERAHLLGADKLATGHYARIEKGPNGLRLLRGVDHNKDQSYFLYRLNQKQLQALWFPLGEMTKSEVRQHAQRLGLQVAEKPESQEICFVGDDGYAAVVERVASAPSEGDIVSSRGSLLGRHRGIHNFTIGQRRGLGIAAPEPLYVTDIDPGTNTIRVGEREDLLRDEVRVDLCFWLGQPPGADETLGVQQRYRETPKTAHIHAEEGAARVRFDQPQPRGAPGQAAVFYRGDEVVGGGRLASTQHAVPAAAAWGG